MKKVVVFLLFYGYVFAQNVLLINSYSSTLEWTKAQSESIVSVLSAKKDVKLFVEYMDTKILKPTYQTEENFLNFYKKKYKNIKFDVVITTDDNALNFVRKYEDDPIFQDSRFFFSGVNNLSLSNLLNKEKYSGVFEEKDPVENLHIAKKAVKGLKTVYLIGDDSLTAQKEIIHYRSYFDHIDDIEFIYLNSKNIDEILDGLKGYKKNSIMMLLVFTSFSKDGKHIVCSKVLDKLTKNYNNPMLIHTNIIGGNCTDGQSSGKAAANKVLKYLEGTPVKDIKFDFQESNKVYLNVRNLNKFDIDIKDLDVKDPILVNKPDSFYELYNIWINSFIAILLIVSAFTVVLMKKNKALRKSTRKIKALNDSLELKVKHALKKLKKQHDQHKDDIVKNTKFSVIGQMAAGITHEINTPLTYIKGNVEMSRYDLADMPENEFKERLLEDNQKVMDGIKRMALIVESMREVSQATPKEREECNLYDTVVTALVLVSNRAKQVSNIYINGELFDIDTIEKSKYDYPVSINKQRIEQVWTIILNNALDELVKIADFEDRRIDIDLRKKANDVEVVFKDNAGGIPKDIIDVIFEPFVSTKESSGIGIGLNVAKKIIDEHDAYILASNHDEGAQFKVWGFDSKQRKIS
ncbi:MAG: ATP-binding protein [Campylobacterota bacterium]|nr:ATP-binding protein [Campylobacterota bacterium]